MLLTAFLPFELKSKIMSYLPICDVYRDKLMHSLENVALFQIERHI